MSLFSFATLIYVGVIAGFLLGRRKLTRPDAWYLAIPAWSVSSLVALCLGFALIGGYEPESRSILLTISGAALLSLPTVFLPRRSGRWYVIGAVAACGVLLLADLAYRRFFGGIVPVSSVALALQLDDVAGSLPALTRAHDLLLLIPAVISLVALSGQHLATAPALPAAGLRRRRFAVAIALVVLALPVVFQFYQALGWDPKTGKIRTTDERVPAWGVVNAHLYDGLHTALERMSRRGLEPAERRSIGRFYRPRRASDPSRATPWFGSARGRNVIFLQLESLAGWLVGSELDGQEVTPFLNRLREKSFYYPSFHDQTSIGRTSDAEFVVLNSLHPLTDAVLVFRRPNNEFIALPKVLNAAGYATVSAHAYDRGFWNRAHIHRRYDFDETLFRREMGGGDKIGWGLSDEVFLERMAAKLATLDQPFFALLITLSLHHPYDGLDSRADLDVGELEGSLSGDYLSGARYVDRVIERFFDDLARRNLLTNTVVVLYGDHDPGLDLSDFEREKIRGWSGADRVPLFIVVPGVPAPPAAGEERFGGHIDIAPTLLQLLGIDPPASFLGSSLLAPRSHPLVLQHGRAMAVDYARLGEDECVTMPLHLPRPEGFCRQLDAAAKAEWEISNLVLKHDLAARLPEILQQQRKPGEQREEAGRRTEGKTGTAAKRRDRKTGRDARGVTTRHGG